MITLIYVTLLLNQTQNQSLRNNQINLVLIQSNFGRSKVIMLSWSDLL